MPFKGLWLRGDIPFSLCCSAVGDDEEEDEDVNIFVTQSLISALVPEALGLFIFLFPSECIQMRECVYVFFRVRVKKEAGRDQCGVCPGKCGCCCTIKSHQFSPVNRLAWSQRYAQENVPGRGEEPGSLRVDGDRHSRTLRLSTQTYMLKLNASLSHSVPFRLSLGSCSKCLAVGTFTSPKPNHSPSCTFSRSTHQIP